jgi:Domain of unknown function (DUF927)
MKFRLVWMGSEDDGDKQPQLRRDIAGTADSTPRPGYEQRDGIMLRRERLQNGRLRYTPLANFTARIVGDILRDDGEQKLREFGIEAELGGCKVAFPLSAAEFGRMNWVLHRLGPKAIVYPGQHQHTRAAIQWFSGSIRQERIFTHLGWKKQGTQYMYLHAGGALGADGPPSGVQVQLPSTLQLYQMQPSGELSERAQSIRTSLRCLSLAPDRVSFPLLSAVYRAPFGKADFSMFLAGKTGVFKTALAALGQLHFGSAMDSAHLPCNFASTANALEALAFHAKDALLVVDDFSPTGRHGDDGLESVAERLFRAAGNQQGRSRMVGNGRLQSPRPPRALLLATGEEVPHGQSIRARLLIVEVATRDVDLATLSECQHAGEEGHLVASMGAFIGWIAGRYDELQQRLQTRSREIRSQGRGRAVHARLPAALAELQSGFELWLEFALETGAISTAERMEMEQRCERAFQELAVLQARYHQASDPACRFVGLLQAALVCGHAHVADRRGTPPESPRTWGWRRKLTGQGWVPQGTRIGWVKESDLFLDPMASYQVAQDVAGAECLPGSQQTLHHRLQESGILASVDQGRQMVQVRRTLEGCPRQVLHLRAKDLAGDLQEAERCQAKPKMILSELSGLSGPSPTRLPPNCSGDA